MFVRGFKSWCETVAVQQRRALRLQPTDPLDPRLLARSLGVAVRTVAEVPGLDAESRQILVHVDPGSWSAVTISDGGRSVIILNPAHARGRTSSDLMHELAHVLIGHDPARVDVAEDETLVLSTYDRGQEDEAEWLSGCLLLPRGALVLIRSRGLDRQAAAHVYGTSPKMLDFRMNVAGIARQFWRADARRADQAAGSALRHPIEHPAQSGL